MWEMASIGLGLIVIGCFVLVARGFYRAKANAHVLAPDEMTISPGWSIGWHFVPVANLVMPYLAVREAWRASARAARRDEEVETRLLPAWWGLWLGTNILGNGATWLELGLGYGDAAFWVDLAAIALEAPNCLIVIALLRRLARNQRLARQVSTFA